MRNFKKDLHQGEEQEVLLAQRLNQRAHELGIDVSFTKNAQTRKVDLVCQGAGAESAIEVKTDFSENAARNDGLQVYFQVQIKKVSGDAAGPVEALRNKVPYFAKLFRAKGFPFRDFFFRTEDFVDTIRRIWKTERGSIVRQRGCRGHKVVINVPIRCFEDIALTMDEMLMEISQ